MSKKLAVFCMVGVLTIGLISGCGSKEKPAGDSAAQEKTDSDTTTETSTGDVSGVLMSLNSDYWHMIESGIINGGAEQGINVKVTGPTSESDITGQVAMIEDQITAGVKGLIIAPCDTKAVLPALEKCKEKNIPVVLIDMDLDEANQNLRETFIGTSEYEAGVKVGEYIVENFEPCKIGVIRGLAGLPSHDARANGMRDTVEEKGFEVITEQPADSERGKAVNVAENILSATPDVKILYCTNDEMALGAYQAVEGKQKQDDIFVIGFDGSPDALKSITEGKLGASLAQKPIEMGEKAVESLKTLFAGGTVESNVYTDTQIIDSSNVEAFQKDLTEQIERADAAKK